MDNIDNPLIEIRTRSLNGIISKLDKDLISVTDLINHSNFVIKFLRSWFQSGSNPNLKAIDLLFRISDCQDGSSLLQRLKTRKTIVQWRRTLSNEQKTETLLDKISDILRNIPEEVLDVPNEKNEEEEEEERDLDSSSTFDESVTLTTDIARNSSLPARLLLPPSTDTCSSLNENPRNYFKRVQFDDVPEISDVLEIEYFAWITLNNHDRTVLQRLHESLSSYNVDLIRETCVLLRHSTFEDYPPEIFLQRPGLFLRLIDILAYNENNGLKSYVAESISTLADKFKNRIRRERDPDFIGTLNLSDTINERRLYETETEEMEEISFEDRINAPKLKREQISIQNFCLLTINRAVFLLESSDNIGFRLVNCIYELVAKMINLLASTIADDYYWNSRELIEIGKELCKVLDYHKTKLWDRFNRICYLLTLKLSVQYQVEFFSDPDPSLIRNFEIAIYDPTLYFSMEPLHTQILEILNRKDEFDIEIKPILKSIVHAVGFIKGTTENSTKSARIGVSCLSLYKSHLFIPKFFKLCITNPDSEDVTKTLLVLLRFRDVSIQTETFLTLHSTVQDVLGLNHALYPDNIDGNIRKIKFLVKTEIIAEILKTGMKHSCTTVVRACEEIVTYLLKSESIFGDYWKTVLRVAIQPNLILFECFVSTDSFPGKLILESLSSDPDLRPVSGLTSGDVLRSNFRLLYHRSQEIRQSAESNLKCLLSREPGSCQKLPRFSDLIDLDISRNFTFLEKTVLNFRRVMEERRCQNKMTEFIKVMEKFCCPLYDANPILRHLNVLLEDPVVVVKFVECDGFSLLLRIWKRILRQDEVDFSANWLPNLLACLKRLLLLRPDLRTEFRLDDENFYGLLRTSFMVTNLEDIDTKLDIAVLGSMTLFSDIINAQNQDDLKISSLIDDTFILPFDCRVDDEEDDHEFRLGADSSSKAFALFKTYWNVCWDGLSLVCCFDKRNKGDENGHSNFDVQLELDEKDRILISTSFPDENLKSPSRLLKASNHKDFKFELEYLNSQLLLKTSSSSLERFDFDKTFRRFLSVNPTAIQDKKVFLSILRFLSRDDPSSTLRAQVEAFFVQDKTIFDFLVGEQTDYHHHHHLAYLSLYAFVIVGGFLSKLDVKFWYLLRQISKNVYETTNRGNSIMWTLTALRTQFRRLDVNECVHLVRFVLECLRNIDFHPGYYDNSGLLLRLLTSLQKIVVRIYELGAIDGSWDIRSTFRDVMTLLHPIFLHRRVLVRSIVFQITSSLAVSEFGAHSLTNNDPIISSSIWTTCLRTAIRDREEACIVRKGAFDTMTHLIDSSTKGDFWPRIQENISGVVIRGISALVSLLHHMNFEKDVLRKCVKRFGYAHGIKYADKNEDDSCGVTASIMMNDNDNDNYYYDCPEPTPSFMASILRFTNRIRDDSFINNETFSILDAYTINLADSVLFEKFPCVDYAEYMTEILHLYIDRRSNFIDDTTLLVTMIHISSVLYLCQSRFHLLQDVKTELLRFLFIRLTRVLSTTDSTNTNTMTTMIRKYENPLLIETHRIVSTTDRYSDSIFRWIAILAHVASYYSDVDVDECESYDKLISSLIRIRDRLKEKDDVDDNGNNGDDDDDDDDDDDEETLCNEALAACLRRRKQYESESTTLIDSLLKDSVNPIKKGRKRRRRRRRQRRISSRIRLLNNACYRNPTVKIRVLNHASFFPFLTRNFKTSGKYNNDANDDVDGVNDEILRLLITIFSENRRRFAIPSTVIKFCPDIIETAKRPSPRTEKYFAIRLLTILSANSAEIRTLIYKSHFLSGETRKDSPILFTAMTNSKRRDGLVLMMDLLLTVTSFSDGQRYVASKCKDLMDFLLHSAQSRYDNGDGHDDGNGILSLAVLRNVSFATSNRPRMLLCRDYLSLLKDRLNNDDPDSIKICLAAIWSLSHNSHKAKSVMREAGITGAIFDRVSKTDAFASLLENVRSVLRFK